LNSFNYFVSIIFPTPLANKLDLLSILCIKITALHLYFANLCLFASRFFPLQSRLSLFASRVFLCKADRVCLQNAGFVCLIMVHNSLHRTRCRKKIGIGDKQTLIFCILLSPITIFFPTPCPM